MNMIARCAAAGAAASVLGIFAFAEQAEAGVLALSGQAGLVAPGAQVEQAHYRRHSRRHYYGYGPVYPRYRYYARPRYYYPSYGYYPAYSYPAYSYPTYALPVFGWGW